MTKSTSSSAVVERSSARWRVEPAFYRKPAYDVTLGPEVVDLCRAAGANVEPALIPDAQQEIALDDIFGLKPGGTPAAFEEAIIACRQNIKTGLFKMCELGWLFVTGERRIVHSAHKLETSQAQIRELDEIIEANEFLSRRVRKTYSSPGDLRIKMMNGAEALFKTRTITGGRGLAGDKVVLDEAFALVPGHMGALMPLLSTRRQAQLIYGSSACLEDSDVLRDVVDRGRHGLIDGYIEWCAPQPGELHAGEILACAEPRCSHRRGSPGCILDREDLWSLGNPTLGERITVEYVRNERAAMPPDQFGRERMGWHDGPGSGSTLITETRWALALDTDSEMSGPPIFTLDVNPEGDHASIVATGLRADGDAHVEITSRAGVMDDRAGLVWVAPRLVELAERWERFAVNVIAGGTAEALKGDVEAAAAEAGVELEVRVTPAAKMPPAAMLFYSKVTADVPTVRHLGQPELTAAVTVAQRRDVGDNAFTFARRKTDANITAAYAAALGVYLLANGDDDAGEFALFSAGSLDMCDTCGTKPHEDPEGDFDYVCPDCRAKEGATE